MVKRHQKQTAEPGGRHHLEGGADPPVEPAPMPIPKDGKPTRVGFKVLDDGRKVRFAKRSGDLIDG